METNDSSVPRSFYIDSEEQEMPYQMNWAENQG